MTLILLLMPSNSPVLSPHVQWAMIVERWNRSFLSKRTSGAMRLQPARLGYMGHVLMENRNGLVVEHCVGISTGTAEPEASLGCC